MMSLYNLLHGVNPATFFILPMLGHHAEWYGRFRDCFVSEDDKINVFTRLGGGNREYHEEDIAAIRSLPGFIKDYDDDFDSTYATFVFDVPEKWRTDYQKIMDDKMGEVSPEYVAEIKRVYPKLAEKIDATFATTKQEEVTS